ncbi:MAG: radical SAM protein [Desulfosarcina sp.]|nr:radical SAM protein [Desulfobacterales bacterium]
MAVAGDCAGSKKQWKFADILADPGIKTRWEKVRRYFFLRESTYDMTNRCNIRCEGCYFYAGAKQFAQENRDPQAWRGLMQAEKERGITFVVLAGAEPALVEDLCRVCYEVIPLGAIATNGLAPIDTAIGYRLHISVWGNDRTSRRIRGAERMLARQIDIYRNDPRAVFVYTFTPYNIVEAREIAEILADNGGQLTFNVFSAPVGYKGDLRHHAASLKETRRTMIELRQAYPQTVLFSNYNAVVHTHVDSLHGLFACPYPRRNPSRDIGLGRSFRQYRADLSWDRQVSCCVPDTDCADCRHYAAGSAIVTSKLFRHAVDPDTFRAWLDYVDTYLAVWVKGYEKGENLHQSHPEPPPGDSG